MNNKTQVDTVKELQSMLKESKKEILFVNKALDKSANHFEDIMQKQITLLEQKVLDLAEETFILRKLPEKVGEYLNSLIPNISAEIRKTMFNDQEKAIASCNQKLDALDKRIYQSVEKLESFEDRSLKKKVISFGITVLLSTIITLGITYYVIGSFPKLIRITPKGDVNIQNSTVSVWDMSTDKKQVKNAKINNKTP